MLAWASRVWAQGPVIVHQVPPRYPATLGAEAWGEVTCEVTLAVSPPGSVTDVRVQGCPDDFVLAVKAATSQWRFEPRAAAAGTVAVRLQLTFPDPGPRLPPYRDFLLGVGATLAPRAALLRGRWVSGVAERPISGALGGDVDVRTTRPVGARETLLVGASFGGERVRGVALSGLGLLHGARLFGVGSELHLPVEAAVQAEVGSLRLHARARLWWSLRDRVVDRAPAAVPSTAGFELGVAVTPLLSSGFEPAFGPRLEIVLREELGDVVPSMAVGLGL